MLSLMKINQKTMKNVLIVLALMFSALSVNAVGFKFGIKLGALVSSVDNTNGSVDGTDVSIRTYPFIDEPVVSFTGGVAAKIDLYKGFGIDPEIMFQQIVGKYNSYATTLDSHLEFKCKVFTLAVPVMLRYRLDLPVVSPMIFTGPVVGFRLQSTKYFSFDPSLVSVDWRVGIGAMIRENIEVSANYNYGLRNFAQYYEDYNLGNFDLKNRATYWTVALGYYF